MSVHKQCRDAECNICRGSTHVVGPNPDWPEINPPEEIVRVVVTPCPKCGSPYHYWCPERAVES